MSPEEKMREEVRKRIQWYRWKHRCESCDATNIVHTGVFRRKWFQKKNGQWELKEQEKWLCESCGHYTWK